MLSHFSIRGRLLAGLAASLALNSACAIRPVIDFTTVDAPASQAGSVSMLTISTRQLSPDPDEVFSGERSDQISLHVVDVSVPEGHVEGAIEWPDTSPPNAEQDFVVTGFRPVDEARGRDWFASQQTDGNVLVFVHGYNVRYEEAVLSFAQLAFDMETNAAPVLFTWPSKGEYSSYLYDRESATWSRDPFEQVLAYAVDADITQNITLFAHSMGSWVVMEALRQMALREGGLDPKIRSVILAAPDLDVDVFKQQLAALGEDRPHVTMLISNDDKALSLMRMLTGAERLGRLDRSTGIVREMFEGVQGLTVVDLSDLEVEDALHHSKFAESPEALDFLSGELEAASAKMRSDALSREARDFIISLTRALDVQGD